MQSPIFHSFGPQCTYCKKTFTLKQLKRKKNRKAMGAYAKSRMLWLIRVVNESLWCTDNAFTPDSTKSKIDNFQHYQLGKIEKQTTSH